MISAPSRAGCDGTCTSITRTAEPAAASGPAPGFEKAETRHMLPTMTAVSPNDRTFDPAGLQRLLDGRYHEAREEIRTVMSRPEFAPVVGLPTAEYREQVLEWAKSLAGEGLTAPGFPQQYGGRGDPGAN